MVRHVRVQCALIRPQGTKDSSTRDPEVNHSTFNTHTHTHTQVVFLCAFSLVRLLPTNCLEPEGTPPWFFLGTRQHHYRHRPRGRHFEDSQLLPAPSTTRWTLPPSPPPPSRPYLRAPRSPS